MKTRPDRLFGHAIVAIVLLLSPACAKKTATKAPVTEVKLEARDQFQRGVKLMDEGADKYTEAIAAFQRAVSMQPDLWEAKLNIGVIELRRARMAAAAKALEDSVNIYPSAEALESLGEVYMRQGKAKKAVDLYERALSETPEDLHLRNRLAAALLAQGRTDEAEAELRAVLGRDADDLEAYNQLASIQIRKDNLDLAELIVNKGLSRHAEDPALLTNLGLIALKRGEDQVAFSLFDRASKADPQFLTGRLNKAAVLLGAGDHKGARLELEFVLKIEPANVRALMGLGVAKRLGGDLKGARESLHTLLELDPSNADAHFNLGVLELDFADNPAGAKKHLESFLELADADHPRRKEGKDRLELIKALQQSG